MSSNDAFRINTFNFTISQVTSDDEFQFMNEEDSVQEYNKTQAARVAQARQALNQADQTREQGVEDGQSVERTISEDLADGKYQKLDAGLKLLCDNELRLIVPSDTLEDSEIHLIETQAGAAGGNHALQDYQMQLMLLEQQNKKRLLLARQEQDNQAQMGDVNMQMKTAENSYHSAVYTGSDMKEVFPRNAKRRRLDDSEDTLAPPSLEPHRLSVEEPCGDHDTDEEATLPIHRDTSEDGADTLETHWATGFEIIYQVKCDFNDSHPVPAFKDLPVADISWTNQNAHRSSTRSHFNGRVPIFDLQAFLDDESSDTSFVVARTIECSNASIWMARSGVPVPWEEKIYIKSAQAKHILQETAECHFRVHADSENPSPPYGSYPYGPPKAPVPSYRNDEIKPLDLYLFHHESKLKQYIEDHKEARSHIEGLLQYSERMFSDNFKNAAELFARGMVDQEHISKLFRPNDVVVGGIHGQPAAFVVHDWPTVNQDNWTTVECWSFQVDGSGFARKRTVLSIPPIEKGSKEISSCVSYPLKYATPELQIKIQANGQKQWDLRTATQILYKGWNVKRDQYYPDARFMIDHSTYRKMHEFAAAFKFDKPSTTFPHDSMPAYLRIEQRPSPLLLTLLSPTIHGFYLNEKKWVHLFVDSVYPVSWNKKAYERLVLPEQTKDLVRALVTVRTSQRGVMQGIGAAGKRTDITGGKGNGLIMLLHGGPGTGKTLTGESVAEIAEMPLYRVTCGDIGTNADAVEKYLATVLHLGKIWNCVLLLDEADVFLEERSMSDLKRNSLVSVFLRILEYYDGILILTSNRVGMFDEAFKSRIQVALHYENLTRSSRKKIWQNFVEMLEEDDEDVNFDELRLHLDELASKELNGRQIRNVLTTARQLAIYREERLDWEHLVQALSVSSDFTAYLKKMQGHSDDQRARDARLR